MEEQTFFFGVKGLFYYKISYGLGYDAVSNVAPDTMHLPTPRRRDGEQMNL